MPQRPGAAGHNALTRGGFLFCAMRVASARWRCHHHGLHGSAIVLQPGGDSPEDARIFLPPSQQPKHVVADMIQDADGTTFSQGG